MKKENLSRAAGINEELRELSHCTSLLNKGAELRVYDISQDSEVIRSNDIKNALLYAIQERIKHLEEEVEKL